MTSQERKAFLGFQQGELDAVEMYKNFATLTDDEELRSLFLDAAKDEGRHAAILSKYPHRKLRPKDTLAKVTGAVFNFVPKKLLFKGIAYGEKKGGDGYLPYVKDYPELQEIINDEYKHQAIFNSVAEKY